MTRVSFKIYGYFWICIGWLIDVSAVPLASILFVRREYLCIFNRTQRMLASKWRVKQLKRPPPGSAMWTCRSPSSPDSLAGSLSVWSWAASGNWSGAALQRPYIGVKSISIGGYWLLAAKSKLELQAPTLLRFLDFYFGLFCLKLHSTTRHGCRCACVHVHVDATFDAQSSLWGASPSHGFTHFASASPLSQGNADLCISNWFELSKDYSVISFDW